MTISTTEYVTEIEAWRQEIEAPLRRDWVSLAGLFELQPGRHRIGTDPSNEIVLPADSSPDYVGVLTFEAGTVTLEAAPEVELFVNGTRLVGAVPLRSDENTASTPDIVTLDALTFFIIERGARTLLRLRDANNPLLRSFQGRRWFPIDEAYRVEGTFVAYDPPKPLTITNLLGDTSNPTSPGYVTYTLDGQAQRLDAGGWREGGLVLHFRDATNGETTYGGGRALITPPPVQGLVTLDFNRTTNLPCVFTAFATCPLPPEQNRLGIPVAAGEQRPDLA